MANVATCAESDPALAEFSRFYLERRTLELKGAGDDERKRKRLEDEFTPRLSMTIVGLDGNVHRRAKLKVKYRFDERADYNSQITVVPHTGEITAAPRIGRCAISGKSVPENGLRQCAITGDLALGHLLAKSELSSRLARPELMVICSLSKQRVLKDEAEVSAVSGNLVASALLKTSPISGKKAELGHFAKCDFTNTEVLKSELAISEGSGKRYRIDEQLRSAVSGKAGHRGEFVS